jgi:imidazole glycerol phosphate synthase subunit HisF
MVTDLARRFEDAGVAAIIYTDINRDGAMGGSEHCEATAALARAVAIPGDRLGRRLVAGRPHMLKTRVIPCLDVKDGRVVKGVNFVDLRDAGDPVEAAIAYDAAGADELCFLDITPPMKIAAPMLDVVRRTAEPASCR